MITYEKRVKQALYVEDGQTESLRDYMSKTIG